MPVSISVCIQNQWISNEARIGVYLRIPICMQNNEHSDAIKHMFPIPLVLGLDIKKQLICNLMKKTWSIENKYNGSLPNNLQKYGSIWRNQIPETHFQLQNLFPLLHTCDFPFNTKIWRVFLNSRRKWSAKGAATRSPQQDWKGWWLRRRRW